MALFDWKNNSYTTGFVAQDLSQVMNSWVAQTQNQVETDLSVENTYQAEPGNITFITGNCEMLRISEDGFWVRGVRVEQTAREAETVYNNFRQWLTWAQLNRE
jgi:hypothetical protein